MGIEDQDFDRRREVRYPTEANVQLRKKDGDTMRATAVDISSSGMRIRFGEHCPLRLDEDVTVEVELVEYPDKPFSAWGLGRVAYVSGGDAGIQLFGGQFDPEPGAMP
jgi:hypothetical protein